MGFGYQSKIFLLLVQVQLLVVLSLAETQVLSLSTTYSKSISRSNFSVSSSLRGRKVGRGRGLLGCDFYIGKWVEDTSYPVYAASSCPFIDSEFDCLKHGRSDTQYLKYAWKPDSCNLPRYILSLSFSRTCKFFKMKNLRDRVFPTLSPCFFFFF